MQPATRLQASAQSGQPPLTFEWFMQAYWYLPGHHRQRLFWTLPSELQAECWAALQAQLDRIRGSL